MQLSRWKHLGGCACAALLMLLVGGSPARAAENPCSIADDAFTFEPYLPKTLQALTERREITVVAIGGASTEGRAASSPEASWPAQFAATLRERFPGAKIDLVVHAASRRTASDMAARFVRDVLPLRPTLVIWESGTADAARGTDIDEFRTTLQEGLEALRPGLGEVILMDMQYSPLTQSVIYFNRYLVVMRGVADVNEVPLFPRHRIMYDWAEMGFLDTSDRSPERRRAMADKVYRCIGVAVADFVTRRPEGENVQR